MRVFLHFITLATPLMTLVLLGAQPANASDIPNGQCSGPSVSQQTAGNLTAPPVTLLEAIRRQQENRLASAPPAGASANDALPPCLQGPAPTTINPAEPAMVTLDPHRTASDRPDVFGSIALPVSHTPLDAKWHAVQGSRLSKSSGPWAPLLHSVAGESRSHQLKAINQWVNARVRFTDDRAGKTGNDHWSTASETLLRSTGDCEDYAIAKMKLLEALGVARADLYLVIANDLVRRADHAVLVVRLDRRLMVLDSSSDQVIDAQQASDYRPIFSYGDRRAWVHGYLDKTTQIAALF